MKIGLDAFNQTNKRIMGLECTDKQENRKESEIKIPGISSAL